MQSNHDDPQAPFRPYGFWHSRFEREKSATGWVSIAIAAGIILIAGTLVFGRFEYGVPDNPVSTWASLKRLTNSNDAAKAVRPTGEFE